MEMLRKLREKVHIAMVGGSDLVKQEEQLGKNGMYDRYADEPITDLAVLQ